MRSLSTSDILRSTATAGEGGRVGGHGREGLKDEQREREGERLVQVVHQSQDLFDAVLNGRLEIKKLRINASWGLVGQSSFFFLFFLSFFLPPPHFVLFLFRFTASPIFSFLPPYPSLSSFFLGTIASASSFNSRPQSELRFRVIVYR